MLPVTLRLPCASRFNLSNPLFWKERRVALPPPLVDSGQSLGAPVLVIVEVLNTKALEVTREAEKTVD